MDEASAPPELLDLTTAIVAAYAGSHTLPASELPELIGSVFGALRKSGHGGRAGTAGRGPGAGGAGQEVGDAGVHRLPRRRQEAEDAQTASGDAATT